MQSLHCPFAFIILGKCCYFLFVVFLPPLAGSQASLQSQLACPGNFQNSKTSSWEILPSDGQSHLISRAAESWALGEWLWLAELCVYTQTPKQEPKFSVMLLCSLGLNESTQWATSGLLRSGNWGNHPPKSHLKSFDCLVEAEFLQSFLTGRVEGM